MKYVVSFFDRGLRTPGSGTNLLQKKQQKEEGRDLSFASYTDADVGVYVQHHDLESLISQSEAREAELAQLVRALLSPRRA